DRLSMQAAFANGDISLILEPSQNDVRSIEAQTKNFKEVKWVSGTWYHNRFNLQREPFNDPRVRRALQLAIDFSSLQDPVFGEDDWFYCSAVPSVFAEAWDSDRVSGLPGFNPDTKDEDIANAKAMMEAAGFG